MHKLLLNHGTKSTSEFRSKHIRIIDMLKKGIINTYYQYVMACKSLSIIYFEENLFNLYIKTRS